MDPTQTSSTSGRGQPYDENEDKNKKLEARSRQLREQQIQKQEDQKKENEQLAIKEQQWAQEDLIHQAEDVQKTREEEVVFKQHEADMKIAVAKMKEEKEKEKQHWEDLRKEKEKREEKHHEYMDQMAEASGRMFRKQDRKRRAKVHARDSQINADKEEFRLKQIAQQDYQHKKHTVEGSARMERGGLDNREQSQLKDVQDEQQKKRSKLEARHNEQLKTLENEMNSRKAVAEKLPNPIIRARLMQSIEQEETRRRKQLIAQHNTKVEEMVALEQKQIFELKTGMQKDREKVSATERDQLREIRSESDRRKRQAEIQAATTKHQATKDAEEILHEQDQPTETV